jgi:hypothetical protein
MKPRLIGDESFEVLKSVGHDVPRDNARYIIPFRVSSEYIVKNSKGETLKVRCTQDCPTHLRVI